MPFVYAVHMDERFDFVAELDGLPRLALNGHDWRNTGLEDTSGWDAKDRRWARDVWVCANCRRAVKVHGHPPVIWRYEGGHPIDMHARNPHMHPPGTIGYASTDRDVRQLPTECERSGKEFTSHIDMAGELKNIETKMRKLSLSLALTFACLVCLLLGVVVEMPITIIFWTIGGFLFVAAEAVYFMYRRGK